MNPARRGRRPLAALAFALAITAAPTLASCGSPAPATTAPRTPVALGSPVTGRLTRLESEGLTRVRGFTLRLGDGVEVAFTIGRLENGVEFPPGHLAEHMSTSSAVRVFFRDEGGSRVVYRLEDGE